VNNQMEDSGCRGGHGKVGRGGHGKVGRGGHGKVGRGGRGGREQARHKEDKELVERGDSLQDHSQSWQHLRHKQL
jgi:hypothetical protein